ncbi:TRAP transporter large permease [Sulfitobacter geojensis]|jgi:tripartite ATP-independent transporter DctM subunit|uniref:TRAP transporter large permease protein n=1 Tax=Sulfitobacter geojensis TaxID=1342299 RepID=A0AAE3B6X2_9RHOB|nr:TRAP transporter large permease [Sulfitobacter geojensis]MBM1689510.1 TRAP transporter large permease [Sulfitobacter geojensis]MBM1693576.1 TRAP transporter large permease [Sulfitobacter geojensis]MBM1705742.1 TRAP transporter large permease [Sulfitobacter geojensis]MBM1709800.1 TRAP transporter large permease [Sulfitobacter geojensis]MBM1713866.1 TRAP transporter large permease [Sulfitobacter geojensis]
MIESLQLPFVIGMVAVLMIMRVPVGISLLLAGATGFAFIRGVTITFDAIGGRLFDIGSGYALSAVPLFLLMGHVAAKAGITQDIYRATRAWLGHLKGSVVIATTVAAVAFAACSGSTTSSTAVFGRVAIPEMLRLKVNRKLAAGCVATVGTLAGMIPPSINLIVYGIIARESVPKLLIAGIVPGLLTAFAYLVMIYIRVSRNPEMAPALPKAGIEERLQSLKGVWSFLTLGGIVIGGIYAGIITPTEAGAIGAVGSFLIALLRKRMSFAVLKEVFLDTAQTTSVIFIILVGALIFSSYLAVSGASGAVSEYIVGLDMSMMGIVCIYVLLLLVLGCMVDPVSVMFLTVPIFVPPLIELGAHPIWLAIVVVKTLEIGLITPPVGLNAFVLKGVAPSFSLKEIFGGIWWFLQVEVITLLMIMFIPAIATILPELAYAK